MIALVDYGLGNLRSVQNALQAVGAEVERTESAEVMLRADKVVLPGVGAFRDGLAGLIALRLVEGLRLLAERGTPLLGICLGMQLLFEESAEGGDFAGLGLLPGKVVRFQAGELKVPQTGWNQIHPAADSPLLAGLESGVYAYFNHAYYPEVGDPHTILATTEYGGPFASIVGRGSLFGVQFHPEKSQAVGLTILRNFVERC
jgi:glutamine amidotransferase